MSGEYDFRDLLERYLKKEERDISWLARQLGKAPSTVSRWYHCETRPQNPMAVLRMAEVLQVPAEERSIFFGAAAAYYGWSRSVFAFTLAPLPLTASTAENGAAAHAELTPAGMPLMRTDEDIAVRVEVRGWWWNQTDRFFQGMDEDAHAPTRLEGMLWHELGQMKDHILYGPAMILTTLLLMAMRGSKRQPAAPLPAASHTNERNQKV